MNGVRLRAGAIPATSLRDAEATCAKPWPGLGLEKTPELLQVLFPPQPRLLFQPPTFPSRGLASTTVKGPESRMHEIEQENSVCIGASKLGGWF